MGGDDTDTPNASLDTPHAALVPNRSSSHAALAIPTLAPNRSSSIIVEEHRHNQSVEDVAKPAAGDLNHDGTAGVSVEGDAGAEHTMDMA